MEWNLFYEVDPSEETMHYLDSSSLLHLNNYSLMRAINLDFRPENDINGYYYLRVINLTKEVHIRTKKVTFYDVFGRVVFSEKNNFNQLNLNYFHF